MVASPPRQETLEASIVLLQRHAPRVSAWHRFDPFSFLIGRLGFVQREERTPVFFFAFPTQAVLDMTTSSLPAVRDVVVCVFGSSILAPAYTTFGVYLVAF